MKRFGAITAALVLAQAAAAPERATVRAYAFTPGEPPTEIRLWRAGENPTDYGMHLWTPRAAELVGAEYERRGNPLQIDVEHSAAMKPGEPAPTGGYARLELRAGEPWLVFDWSAFAVDQIASRQRLFLSPEYLVDKRTNEIVKLIRVSLVGDPGTHNAKMLASAETQRIAAKRGPMDPKLIAQALEALIAKDSEKAMSILQSMIAQAAGAEGAEPPAADAPPMAAGAPPPAAVPPPADNKDDKVVAGAPAPAPSAAPAVVPVAAAAAPIAAPPARDPLIERIDNFERDQLFRENLHRIQSDAVRAWAAKQPLAVLRDYVSALPSVPAGTPGARSVAATRGAGQGTQASRLPPEEKRELDERMGLRVARPIVERKGNVVAFRAASREECAQHIAARAKGTAAPAANGGVK